MYSAKHYFKLPRSTNLFIVYCNIVTSHTYSNDISCQRFWNHYGGNQMRHHSSYLPLVKMMLSHRQHYNDVTMGKMASQITSLTIVYSIVYSGRRSKKTPKFRVTGLGNSPVTGEFPAQRASNAENVSIWWRRHNATFPMKQKHFKGYTKLN